MRTIAASICHCRSWKTFSLVLWFSSLVSFIWMVFTLIRINLWLKSARKAKWSSGSTSRDCVQRPRDQRTRLPTLSPLLEKEVNHNNRMPTHAGIFSPAVSCVAHEFWHWPAIGDSLPLPWSQSLCGGEERKEVTHHQVFMPPSAPHRDTDKVGARMSTPHCVLRSRDMGRDAGRGREGDRTWWGHGKRRGQGNTRSGCGSGQEATQTNNRKWG